jgi:tRNA A-37 threonylcarbamoyl transferase component Bud32
MGDAGKQGEPGLAAEREPDGALARIGTVVDKYTIVRMLGRGGMGAVFEARHARLARRFAIKFLLPEFAANREILRRFENEAKAAGGLEHPNLAAVTDFGRADDGSPYLVMEYLGGEDCSKLLRRLGPLSVPRAANIVLQACRGLAVAHAATIVHRDLKPENLFVTDAGDGSDLIKVLDFGIAKLRISDASVITGTGATFGTAFYMSPEQARGAGDVDPRTDVWSLGIVLYELLSGRKPFLGEQFLQVIHEILSFEAPSLSTLRPDLPPKLVAVIEAAMKKDLAQRLPSVVALAEALAPFAGTRATDERRPSPAALAATAATPATNVSVGTGALSRGVATGVSEIPPGVVPSAARRGGAVKLGLALGAAVVLAGVVALVLGRGSSERRAAVVQPAPPPVVPSRPVAIAPPSPPLVPPPPAVPVTPPAVRTVSESVAPSSNKRGAHGATKRKPAPTLAPAAPNPAPPLEKPAPGHRIEIDKDDPFGGP